MEEFAMEEFTIGKRCKKFSKSLADLTCVILFYGPHETVISSFRTSHCSFNRFKWERSFGDFCFCFRVENFAKGTRVLRDDPPHEMYNRSGRHLSYFVQIQNIKDTLCHVFVTVGKKIISEKRETKEKRNTREVAI